MKMKCICEKKRCMFHKKKGSMMKMLPILLAMVAVAAMSVMYLDYMSDYDKREKADQVAREYILKMETEGYLTPDAKNELMSKLTQVGISNINFQGTTLGKVGYGEEVTLMISGTLSLSEYNFERLFEEGTRKENTCAIKISKKSTAKC